MAVDDGVPDGGRFRSLGEVPSGRSSDPAAGALAAMHEAGETLVDLLFSFAPAAGSDERPDGGRFRSLGEVPSRTPSSTAMAKALKARGFRFVGPVVAYALMQSAGIVDDHLEGCWVAV